MPSNPVNPEFLTVMARMGVRPDPIDPKKGSLKVSEGLESHGVIRVAPLMLLADMIVGMELESSVKDWTFTTDFSFRRGFPSKGKIIEARSRILRHGKRIFIEELDYLDESGNSIGYAQITFLRTPLREGEMKPDISNIRMRMAKNEIPDLDQPIGDLSGIRVEDPSIGRAVLFPHDAVRRPGGFVQGAIMTLLGEISAQSFGENYFGEPCSVTALDARYMVGGRSGPLTTTAQWVTSPDQGFIRVSLVDEGHQVLSCSFLAEVVPSSHLSR